MNRDPNLEAKIKRAAKRLGDLVGQYADQTGRPMSIMCTSDGAYVIDVEADAGWTMSFDARQGTYSRDGDRSVVVEVGGSVVLGLPTGDTTWSYGEW